MLSNDRELGVSDGPSKVQKAAVGRPLYILVALLFVLLIPTLVLAAVSVGLGASNQDKLDKLQTTNTPARTTSSSYSTSISSPSPSSLESAVVLEEVFDHLRQFQRLADAADGSRTTGTQGFNLTLDYIRTYLSQFSELVVRQDVFATEPSWLPFIDPILITYIDGLATNHSLLEDFYYVKFSKRVDFPMPVRLTVVQSNACNETDWQAAAPYPANAQSVVLIKRNDRCLNEAFNLASKYNVAGLLIFNDGTSPNSQGLLYIAAPENISFPVFFLTYTLGNTLAQAARNLTTDTSVIMKESAQYTPSTVVGNICAWTRTGDATRTIVIGSHSDSVPGTAGINDNGSGSAANLVLAATLARLYQSNNYEKYSYRIKFCWWAAEELGYLGSIYHKNMAKNSTTIGERLEDYLVYLNYDMLGSPNYMFGIYDASTIDRNTTPSTAIPGSLRVTELYRSWFNNQSLPWTNQNMAVATSDQVPFVTAGVVAGGLFSGANLAMKSTAERNSYQLKLGQGRGGVADAFHDPCYHKACDTIENINTFGLQQMTKAAAFAIEYLGRLPNLRNWLYPTSQIRALEQTMQDEGRQLLQFDPVKAFYESRGMKFL